MATITTRVSNELAKDIRFFSELEKIDRSAVVRKLLSEAVEERLIEHALSRYKEGEVTLWGAAHIAKVSLRRMMKEARDREISMQYSLHDLREDFKAALE